MTKEEYRRTKRKRPNDSSQGEKTREIFPLTISLSSLSLFPLHSWEYVSPVVWYHTKPNAESSHAKAEWTGVSRVVVPTR